MNNYDAITITLNPAIDRTLTIPNFAAGKVNRVQESRDNPGGKGVNVASALADCGLRVAVTGFLGNENTTEFDRLFARKQITNHFVEVDGPTRIGLKIVDPLAQQTTDINFPGFSPAPANFEDLDRAITELAGMTPTWFVLSGSLPSQTPVTLYRDLISKLKKIGHSVLLDTSGEPLRLGLESTPTVLKPNLHELESLVGSALTTEAAIISAARNLICPKPPPPSPSLKERAGERMPFSRFSATPDGIELIVVSMGEKGALFITLDQVLTALPSQIDVKSTVGAGDAMVAGIVAGQIRKESLPDCARRATAMSLHRLHCSATGCESPFDLEKWASKVTIRP